MSSEIELDPIVLAAVGPVPEGMNLYDSQETPNAAAAIVCGLIALISVCLRMWARNIQAFSLKVEDYLLIVGLFFVFCTVGLSIAGGHYGAGKHVWALDHVQLYMIFKLLFAYTYIYAACVTATKISLLLFYRRIFSRGGLWFNIRLGFAMFLVCGYPFAIWLFMASSCRPVRYFYTQFLGEQGYCVGTNDAFMSLTIINMTNDIIVLCVPIPEILKLQMTRSKKAAVVGIMLLGSFVCTASVVRIVTYDQFMKSVDSTWLLGYFFLWSSIEPAFGVLCACLPAMRPLWLRFHDSVFGKKQTTVATDTAASKGNWSRGGQKSFAAGQSYVRFGADNESKRSVDDEIALTKIGKGFVSDEVTPQNVIMVRREIAQESN